MLIAKSIYKNMSMKANIFITRLEHLNKIIIIILWYLLKNFNKYKYVIVQEKGLLRKTKLSLITQKLC